MSASQPTTQEARHTLYEIVRQDSSFEEKAAEALELGKQYLGVENGHLTRIDQETDHWEAVVSTDLPDGEFPPGLELDLETTYCRRVIAGESPVVLHDAPTQGWKDDPAFETHSLSCYHGTTLVLDDEPYGTICFVNDDPRSHAFSDSETMFVELIAQLLERELEREQHEAELARRANLVNMLNRVLRHNLRNDLCVVRGRVQLMTDRIQESEDGQIALRKIDELIELTQKARELEWIVNAEFERVEKDIVELVESVVSTTEQEFPTATFHLESEADLTVATLGSFERALEELLENAAKHCGESPNVRIRLEQVPNAVEVHISDDGPGMSSAEQTVLKTGEESPLIHGSGIGLWLVHWIVSSHDGTVEATSTDSGTTVSVSIPRVAETDARQEMTKLTQARDRYQEAFDKASDAMLIIDDETLIVDANPAAATVYGLTQRKLLGKSIEEFLPAEFEFESA